ncbi:MAG: PEP-CTERM sorting domain-containing protein [Armatimonadetes bacterium]|nr:PEP-CTERM sorting domain-containing protein [Armatimonadota bacterium]MBS1726227.1 PEP-CTERM sorting domain-containing protein [Armatimonadota bacterium]
MKGIFVGALITGLAGSAMARPELNAFINKPANSVPELIAQIKSDKQVADRFMRHFSMTKDEVLEFVGSLHLGTLKESGYYTIYSAPDTGIIKAHVSFFKKGTPAFVDEDGNAILRAKCANPFVRGPIRPYALSSATVTDSVSTPMIAAAPGTSVSEGPMIASFTPPTPPVPEIATPITIKTTPTDSAPQQFAASSIGSIIGLGGVASFINRGHSSPVPEPASFAVLGIGALALLRRRKK